MMIFGSPQRYIQGPDALAEIGQELARLGGDSAILFDSAIPVERRLAVQDACRAKGVAAQALVFGGECTDAEIDRLAGLLDETPGTVTAIGGGKCIDAGKALAHRLGARIVTAPSIASTDAPTSHIYVIYDESHRLSEVRKLPRNPDLVIVDTSVIAAAPKALFLAGIGDAIGKCHEVRGCAEAQGRNMFGGTSPWAAVALADACHDLLRRHARDAVRAVDAGRPDAALERVVEATVLISGLAFESGGLSVAHSMTRGLTAVAPWSGTMHGLQVAYANLVQMHLQGADEAEIDDFAGFCGELGLPLSLQDLGGRAPDQADLDIIATQTMTAPHIRHLPRQIDIADLRGSIAWVEARFGGRS